MRTRILPLLAALALLAQPANAQHSGNWRGQAERSNPSQTPAETPFAQAGIPSNSLIEFEVNALANLPADAYVAIFSLQQVGPDVEQTEALMAERVQGFARELARMGIAGQDLHIDLVSFLPIYEYEVEKKVFSRAYVEVPAGFELKKNVHVRFRSASLMDSVIRAAARNQIYDIAKVDYFLDDLDAHYDSLRAEAYALMERKLERLARLVPEAAQAHRVLDEALGMFLPEDRYREYQSQGASARALLTGKTIVAADRPTTRFYHAYPYAGFELVRNPVVLEPCVQLTYSLKLRLVLDDPNQAETRHYLIGADGQLREVKLD